MYKLNISAIGDTITYGISVVMGDDIIKSVINISKNRQRVESLIDRMNNGNIALMHFDDAIEDFIA